MSGEHLISLLLKQQTAGGSSSRPSPDLFSQKQDTSTQNSSREPTITKAIAESFEQLAVRQPAPPSTYAPTPSPTVESSKAKQVAGSTQPAPPSTYAPTPSPTVESSEAKQVAGSTHLSIPRDNQQNFAHLKPAATLKIPDKLSVRALTCKLAELGFGDWYSGQPECRFHKLIHRPRHSDESGETCPLVLQDTTPFKTHQVSPGTEKLLKDIGGGDVIRQLCARFYVLFMLDKVLCTFIVNYDGPAAHGDRLGDWIVQKMGGEGEPWTASGRWNLREASHYRAWVSLARPPQVRGRKFKLDDCRVWMRLMFWAVRQVRLHEHVPFFRWYVQFIGHFITVYETTAGPYAQQESEWSADEKNLRQYEASGRLMLDVVARPELFQPRPQSEQGPQHAVYGGFDGTKPRAQMASNFR